MFAWIQKHLALAAAICMAAAISGCSGTAKTDAKGGARVSVDASAFAAQGDVAKITVNVSGAGIPAGGISVDLTKSSAGFSWSGFLDGLPAGAARTFEATAFHLNGTALYRGQTAVNIEAGKTAVVVIVLQDLTAPGNQTENAPAITALTASDTNPIPSTATAPSRVSLSVTAADRNTPAAPLSYLWTSSCASAVVDNGAFDLATSASPIWTAPLTTPGPTTCTLSVTVTNSKGTSVKTFLTITVALSNGAANVSAFVNTNPVISSLFAKFVYDRAGNSQVVDFDLAASDPDADNLAYAWSSNCDGQGTWTLSGANPAGGSFSQLTPRFSISDPTRDCAFTVAVTDLCTAGNCGANVPGATGARPDGAARGGQVTGVINGKAPAAPAAFPKVVRTTQPVDGQIDVGGAVVNLGVFASDPQGGALSFVWTAPAGSSFVAGSQVDSIANGTSFIQWTAPATLVPSMPVTVAITSAASGLTTTHTITLRPANPCIGKLAGDTCDTGNLCVARGTETCSAAGVCQGGTATVTCTAQGACFDAGTCNPNTGACTNPQKADNTSCSADACLPAACQAGVCTPGTAVTCTGPAGICHTATGATCSTVNNAPVCNYPVTAGAACSADLCNPATCSVGGACVPGTPVTCASPGLCETAAAATCNPATGACSYPADTGAACTPSPVPACSSGFACTAAKACVGVQDCTQNSATCCTGAATCNPVTKACQVPVPTPTAAVLFPAGSISAAMDQAGGTYAVGPLFGAKTFGAFTLTSAGSADLAVVKYDAVTHAPVWATAIGGGAPEATAATDQIPVASAVTADGTVVVIGGSSGNIVVNATTTVAFPSLQDFIVGVNGATGAGVFGKAVNNGNGVLLAVAANPKLNLFAVCGYADAVSTLAPAGTTFGGGTGATARDAVIGVYDSAGTFLWGKQLNSPSPEECNTLAIDDAGDVYVAGKYGTVTGQASINPGLGALPATGLGTRRFIWVAKYRGTDGTALAQASFGAGNGNQSPLAMAVDAAGNVILGGSFSNSLPFGATTLVGLGQDGFIARLSPTLVPTWALRLGSAGSTDLVSSVATTSFGEVLVTGTIGGGVTTGAAALTTASASDDVFLLKLDPVLGTTQFAANYGDGNGQAGTTVLVNRFGATNQDLVQVAGTFGGSVAFGALAPLTTVAGDAFLLWAPIQ